jgi:hypothetical protein
MSSYTITIAADDAGQATTTLKVEVTETAARITELLVRAGHSEGLTAGQVPAVDLDLLLRAVAPATQGQPAIPAPAPAPVATPAATPATAPTTAPATGTPSDSAETASATTITAESPSTTEDAPPAQNDPAPAAPAQTGPADAAEPTPAAKTTRKASRTSGTTATTRKRTAAAKPAPVAKTPSRAAKAAKPKKTSDAAASGSDRVYRRSPEDLGTVFQQVGTVAGIADHYNVPRHTAQGWVRTLRRKQTVPNPQ